MPDGFNQTDPAEDLTPVYEDAGKKYGIDPDLLRAQTRVESSNDPYARSPAGAEGMSQFIPSTADAEGLKDPFDPRESIPAQAKLLRENANAYGSMSRAIGAYHSGSGDPSQWGQATNDYLDAMEAEYARTKARNSDRIPIEPRSNSDKISATSASPQPPAIGDQINTARKAGYSDDEIASYLQQTQTWAPKFEAARKAGYGDDEIFNHLGLKVRPPQAPQTGGQEGQKQAGNELQASKPADTGWLDAITQGLGAGIRGGAQTYQALTGGKPVTSEPTTAAAQPIEWGDVRNPGLLGRKFLYGIAASAPQIAGFTAGSALAGGPETPVGLAAGAAGAAIADAATTLGPAFGSELKATPQDPDGAFNRALKQTGVGSAFTGLGFAAFGINPFEGTLKNIVFQAFGVQPAVAVGQTAAQNVVAGRPAGENLFQMVPGAIATTAAPMLAHSLASRFAGRGEAAATEPVTPQVAAAAPPGTGEVAAAPAIPQPGRPLEEEALAELEPEPPTTWRKPGIAEEQPTKAEVGPKPQVAAEAQAELEQIAKGAAPTKEESAPPSAITQTKQIEAPPPVAEPPAPEQAPVESTPLAPWQKPGITRQPPPVGAELEPRPPEPEVRPPPPEEPKPAPPETAAVGDPDSILADNIAARLRRGQGIDAKYVQAAGDAAYGGKLSEGAYGRDRLYDAQELGINRFIQSDPTLFDPRVDAAGAHAVVADLSEMKDKLPTQTVRAGEKDTHQQFSTPPDYAYTAAWVANLRPEDRVLEPSAGTGSLAVMAQNAQVAEVVANEISEKRRNMLSHLGVDRLTAEDARQLHNALPDEIKPSVVLMNPPFSAAPGRMGNKMVLGEGAAHVKAALDRLEPGGRLVAIVGRGMTMDAPAFKDWWNGIANQYDVRANVGVGGKIYQKYGTNFGTRLLVIDKPPIGGLTGNGPPVWRFGLPVGGEVTAAADLIDKLKDVRNARASAGQPMGGEPPSPEVAPAGQGAPGPEPVIHPPTGGVGPGVGGGEPAAAPVEPVAAKPAGRGTTGPRPGSRVRGKAGEPRPGGAPVEPEPRPGGAEEEPGPRPETGPQPPGGSQDSGGSHIRPDGSDLTVAPPNPELVKTNIITPEPETGGELNESVYESYKPQRVTIEGAQPHPGPLVQSAAMASVDPPAPKYNTAIPRKLIASGGLSEAQLESIVYAGDAHSKMLADNERRRGFFIGDGTGVGKGREVAGIILDNWQQGRKKAIWVSEKMGLSKDAQRDWTGLGQSADQIIPHGKIKAADPIGAKQGILFTTYDTVKSGEKAKTTGAAPTEGEAPKLGKSRVDQIVDWVGKDFDGVLAFDEAHNMGNAVATKGKRGITQPAAKALAGIELQQKLPNARVVYVSATGATEVSNLSYADRLGLWGEGTAFPNRAQFINEVSSGGVAAMELVARDMKALGHYMARNLSYEGVEYDRMLHPLIPEQRMMYDKIAEGWQVVLRNMMKALEETGQTDENDSAKKGSQKSGILSAFWGGHQRFFNQLITSLQMPTVLRSVERDVAEGRQAVLQLVNTNEAGQERAIDKARAEGAKMEDLEELDMSPRDQLMQLVQKAFPVTQFEDYMDEEGNLRTRPAKDSAGNPVISKAAVAMREKLLDDLGSLRVPDGPLEILMNHFGPDAVAEVTGRKQRVVNKLDENGVMKRMLEKRGAASNEVDSDAFQNGKKKILVFSQAGGTGRSYHADNSTPSSGARRSHYLVQAGWRADTAVQGFGRTHRTNQGSAPIFHLVTTDLEGQKRFISSIARRLGQLGALTKGERRTGDQGLFGLQDNLESDEAKSALIQFYRDVVGGRVKNVTADDMSEHMGLHLVDPMTWGLRADPPPMTQFLNRILSLGVDAQNHVFNEFATRFRDVIQHATEDGTLDAGVETYKADKIAKQAERTVYTDPDSGAQTKYVRLETSNRQFPTSFEATHTGKASNTGWAKPDFYVQNTKGNIAAIAPTTYTKTTAEGVTTEHYRAGTPTASSLIPTPALDAAVDKGTLRQIFDPGEAKQLWDQQVAATPEFKTEPLHLITGAVLPIWDRLAGKPKIYRLQTDAGETMLGRVVDKKSIAATLDRLSAGEEVKATPAETIKNIMEEKQTAKLSNGWTIKPSLVAGEWRMEVKGPDLYAHTPILEKAGVFRERIAFDTRYFIPTGEKGEAAIAAITKTRPVVGFGDEGGGARASDEELRLYAGPGAIFDPAAWRRAFGNNTAPGAVENLRDKEGVARVASEIKAGLAPTSLRGAKPMEYAIRGHTSRSAQAFDQAAHRLDSAAKTVDRLSMQDKIATADIHEHGQGQANPELQAASAALRAVTDEWKRKIQGLGRGYLANAIDNYMAHIWANHAEWRAGNVQPTNQAQAMVQATGRNVRKIPLTGSANFLKQRFFPTQLEGINAGLVPIDYNWVRTGLVKIHEMQKFYHGITLGDQIKQTGIAHWVRDSDARAAIERGEVPLDDKIFQPKLYGVTPIGPVEPGKWYAPEPAARVFNNYMSQGWGGSSIYNALRQSNNALNGLQLGIGGFHAAFVTNDVATSKVALGIQQIARGELGRGGANLLFGTPGLGHLAAVTDSLRKGGQVRREWLDPGSGSPEVQRVVNAIKAGGYRMTMPDFFRTATSGPFFKSWNDLKNPGSVWNQVGQMFREAPTAYQKAIMTPIRIAARTLDTVMEPLMGAMVPRAKAGVMYDLTADWLRRNPTASSQQLSEAMTKFQDSVDNRLGQLNYDNLFWNRTLKDLAFITTRSVGWNLGTIREIGGAVGDLSHGLGPRASTRVAYTMAMPAVTGMLGAMMTYLATGQGPQSLLDYFYPPTGGETPQGDAERRSIPGYMKDVFAYAHAPVQTLLNKTSPMVEAVNEIRQDFPHGRTYYGDMIYNPLTAQGPVQAYGDWIINQATPFSLRSWGRLQGEGAPALDQALGFFGFQPAPASITHPEREEKYERLQERKSARSEMKNVQKGLVFHLFNQPAASGP